MKTFKEEKIKEFREKFLDGRYDNRLMMRIKEKNYTRTAKLNDLEAFISDSIEEAYKKGFSDGALKYAKWAYVKDWERQLERFKNKKKKL